MLKIFNLALFFFSFCFPVQAELKIVVSIKPLHGLVSSIMEGAGSPTLLVKQNADHHHHSLKPSEARALQEAELVFWGGPTLEEFLIKPLDSLASAAEVISLVQIVSGQDEDIHYKDGDHDDEAKHEAHDEHAEQDDHPAHEGYDPHFWLDPQLAKIAMRAIRDQLLSADPQNSAVYAKNYELWARKLDLMHDDILGRLAPFQGQRFVSMEPEYGVFTQGFKLTAPYTLLAHEEVPIGAQDLKQAEAQFANPAIHCFIYGPEASDTLINNFKEEYELNVAMIDVIGIEISAGPKFYEQLMENMAKGFVGCLS